LKHQLNSELNFLIKLLSSEFSSRQVNWTDDVDEELFNKWVQRHRVSGLTQKLCNNNSKKFPEKILHKLLSEAQKNAFNAMQFCREIIELNKILYSEKIRFAVVKGLVLSNDLYGDIGIRHCGDIDILINVEDFSKVDKIMTESGYRRCEFQHGGKKRLDIHLSISHQLSYFHPTQPIHIEFIRSVKSQFYFPDVMNFENHRYVKLAGQEIATLKDELHFVELCIHGAGHLWERLQWLMDIALFMKKDQLNWTEVAEIAKEREVEELVWSGVTLCNELFDLRIPQELEKMTLDVEKTEKLLAYSRDYIVSMEHKAETQKLRIQRSRFLLSLSKQVDWKYRLKNYLYNIDDWNTIKLPQGLYFMYFVLRPFLHGLRMLKLVK